MPLPLSACCPFPLFPAAAEASCRHAIAVCSPKPPALPFVHTLHTSKSCCPAHVTLPIVLCICRQIMDASTAQAVAKRPQGVGGEAAWWCCCAVSRMIKFKCVEGWLAAYRCDQSTPGCRRRRAQLDPNSQRQSAASIVTIPRFAMLPGPVYRLRTPQSCLQAEFPLDSRGARSFPSR